MDERVREKARDVVRTILEAASYDVDEVVDDGGVDLSAVCGSDAVLVLCTDDPEEADVFDQTTYRLMVGDDEIICRKLLFTLNDEFTAKNTQIWGVNEFVRHAGEAALARVLERRLVIDLCTPFQTNGVRTPSRGEVYCAPVPQAAETPATEMPVPEQEDEADLIGPEIPHLHLKISERRAMGIAGMEGEVSCRFIPYWYYHVKSSGERTFRDKLISFDADEEGAMSAINGVKIGMDAGMIEKSPVPFRSEVLQPKIECQEAEERIIGEVVDKLTQRVKVRSEKGDAIFYEEKVFSPPPGNLDIEMSLVYLPVWTVRGGGNRVVEVNGCTGEVLAAPAEEGVEVF